MTVRIAGLATALVLAAALGGCSGSSRSTGSSTTSVGAVASAPTAADGAGLAIGNSPVTSGRNSTAYSGTAASTADTAKTVTAATTSAQAQKLIVVNKTMRVETTDVQGTLTKIRQLAATSGGDITSMQVSTSVDEPVYATPLDGTQPSAAPESSSVPLQAYVTIRVPSTTYAAFIADAARLGKVLYQSESADDVTQQHVDMRARLGNLQAEQGRLRKLFSKAKNVDDMLAIEQELTRVQGDIESMQAQLTYLENQAAMATVTIQLTEPVAIGTPAGVDWGVSTAVTDAIRAFVNTMNGLIVILGPVLAICVFVGLPLWLVVWLVRRSLHRRQTAKPATADTTPASAPSETRCPK
jgi:hypothetical protein